MTLQISSDNNRFTIKELIYYAYFAIMLIAKGFGLYQGQKLYTFALAVSALLIAFKVLSTKHNLYEWAAIALLCALALLIYRNSDEIGALIIVATIIGIKDVPVRRIMTVGCVIWTFTFFVRMLTSLLHLNRDIFKVQDKFHLGFVIRWSLGQPHPNVLQISFILFSAFILYLTKFKGRKLYLLTAALFLGNLYVFLYSFSITGIILAVFYLMLNLYLTDIRGRIFKSDGLSLAEKILFIAVIPVSAVFSIAGPLVLTGKVWDFFNKLFNTRFNIAREYMRMNPVTLFGTGHCYELPPDLNNLDCSYVFALMHYGVIFLVLMIAAYVVLVIWQIKNDRFIELAITISFAVAAISEPFFVNPSFKNVTWVFIGELMYLGLNKLNELKKLPEFGIFKIGDNETDLPSDRIVEFADNLKETYSRMPRIIFGTSVMIGVLIGCLYADFKQMPNAYYMNRSNVQVIDKGFTLDIDNLPDDFDGKILEYTDAQTKMFRIDGNAVTMEYIRGIVSMMVWGFALTAFAMGITVTITVNKDFKVKNEDRKEV